MTKRKKTRRRSAQKHKDLADLLYEFYASLRPGQLQLILSKLNVKQRSELNEILQDVLGTKRLRLVMQAIGDKK